MSSSKPSSRRTLLRYLACAPAAVAFGAGVAGGQEPALQQCVSDEDEAMRVTLGYVELSPYGAEKDCRNCEFWIPQEAGAACGGCTLIAGTIDPLAYCDAWALAANYVPPAEAPPATEAPPAGEAAPSGEAPPAVEAPPAAEAAPPATPTP